MTAREDFPLRLQRWTERILTIRLKRRLRSRMKQQSRNPVLDWILAILWAACFVLLVNQYIFQAYRIPSGSMESTLLIGDMIVVDKLSFGPELLPGVAKTDGIARPRRGQIIVFENPTYLSRGPVFTIAQQMLYMLTLTLVDIDRDENGEQRVHYLIKRAMGVGGDRIRVKDGEVSILPEGAGSWMGDRALMQGLGLPLGAHRLMQPDEYPAVTAAGKYSAIKEAGLAVPAALASTDLAAANKDGYGYDSVRVAELRDMYPHDSRISEAARRYGLGWYIAPGRIFPMGDNRDNSRDARYFGPVSIRKVLGHALFRYWPLTRAGATR